MSSARSPRRTPARSPAAQAFTPTRISRLEEKEELQELNARLERYINKQRESEMSKDTLSREMQAVRDLAAEELEHAQEQFNAQIAELRAARDKESQGRLAAEAERARLQNELDVIRHDREEAFNQRDRLKAEAQQLDGDLKEAQLEARRYREESIDFKGSVEGNTRKLEMALEELERLREETQESLGRAAEAESRAAALSEDLALLQARSAAEARRYRDQVEALTHRAATIEDELRHEFANQVAELVADRASQSDREKDEGMALLKAAYDEKIRAFRDHLERAGHELELMRAAKARAEAEAQEAVSRVTVIREELDVSAKRITELETEVTVERDRPNRQLAEKNEIIRRIKASFKRKDEEFDDLMDVKIALAMEIKAYREMLEKEERRLGYKSPSSKKRKLDDMEADSLFDDIPRGESDGSAPTLVISGQDLEGRYIVVKNASTGPISLRGWSLQSSEEEFKCPVDLVLQPKQSVTVHTGPGADKLHNPPTDFCWTTQSPWDPRGDVALLLNPQQEVVAEYNILPTVFDDTNLPQAEGAAASAQKGDDGDGDDDEEEEEGGGDDDDKEAGGKKSRSAGAADGAAAPNKDQCTVM